MINMLLSFLSVACVVVLCSSQVPPFNETCVRGTYPPPAERSIPWYTINLDLEPKQRWAQLGMERKQQIGNLIVAFKQFMKDIVSNSTGQAILDRLDKDGPKLNSMLPQPYQDEIAGMAAASGLQLGEVLFYNIFYEFFTVCTSIVAQDPSGKLYHGRNLDFGLFLGWDIKNRTWEITEILRPTIVNLDFQKGGKTVFKSVNFAGYIGILTAVKPQMFTLSMDERFKLNGGYIGIIEWLLGVNKGKWMGFLTRDTMEYANSYEEAMNMLAKTEMMAPAYFILGGTKPGEGSVITRNRSNTDTDIWKMEEDGKWYILETNYDHWSKPLFLDDRRTPAHTCMNKLTSQSVGYQGLFDVLSSKPVLNKLTTYTALMQVDTGHLESWIQYCPDPCFPW